MTDRARYFKNRKEGLPAAAAKRSADVQARPPRIEWDDRTGDRSGRTHLVARFPRDGFELFVAVKYDQDDCVNLRGQFLSRYKPGAVRNPNARHDRNVCEWFLPDNSYHEHYTSLRGKGYHLGRHEAYTLARKYVLEDLRWALGCGTDWSPCYIEAKAFRSGVMLGSAIIGGYATTDGKEYLAQSADEVVSEAVDEAQEALKRLCPCPESPAP